MNLEQNVSWNDQSSGYKYDLMPIIDETRTMADNADAELGNFFQRPLKIDSFEWSTTVSLYREIDPWSLYCENPRVIERLNNFHLLKANLNVRVLINGNGFYYGRLLANYKPRITADGLTQDRALIAADNVAASQRPHIYIDPTTNQGGEIVLPFFQPQDAMSIVERDWQFMGTMSFRELNPLQHANGATDPITITVLAWMSDVSLTVPTAVSPAGVAGLLKLPEKFDEGEDYEPQSAIEEIDVTCCQGWRCICGTPAAVAASVHPPVQPPPIPEDGTFRPQAGKESKPKPRVKVTKNKPMKQDEYGTPGPVSGPSATVARVAGMLTNAPVIGPYAKATEIAAKGIMNIARIFGYSRAQTQDPIALLTPRFYNALAPTDMPDTAEKLALTSKQELTVDPSIAGLGGGDELVIKNIAARESYLDTAVWNTSDPVDQVLMSLSVQPDLVRAFPTGGDTEYHMPSSAFALKPFKFWRGSVKYRFQVVASAYHKGRLKIQWDPYVYGTQETNVQYTHIIDISEDKDFTIEIGWGSEFGWLYVAPIDQSQSYSIRLPFPNTVKSLSSNGVVTVSVLNTLTSPSLSAGDIVYLNTFISAGDDIEVAVPTQQFIENVTYRPEEFVAQSGTETTPVVQEDSECTEEPSAPMQSQIASTMGNNLDVTDNALSVYHGESITSFRSLLKRYNLVGFIPAPGNVSGALNRFTSKHYPPMRGFFPFVSWGIGSNQVQTSLMNYLYPAFSGLRGGVRWKAAYVDQRAPGAAGVVYIRNAPEATQAGVLTTQTVNLTSSADVYTSGQNFPNSWEGIQLSPKEQNPVVEVEIPYQAQRRFTSTRNASNAAFTSDRMIEFGAFTTGGSAGAALFAYCAAAEDFNLHFFVGAPVVWLT